MNTNVTIYVEGAADERFVRQLCLYLWGDEAKDLCIVKANGWTGLDNEKEKGSFINQMHRRKDDGGCNLVIFDADESCSDRDSQLRHWAEANDVDLEIFLIPNHHDSGALEDLLERIINPQNEPVMSCWHQYEQLLSEVDLPWKKGKPLTIPAKKTEIYAYLEVLLGKSKSQKELIKDNNRDYTNENHWDLRSKALIPLIDFLRQNLG